MEFMTKAEVKPHRQEFKNIIDSIRRDIRNEGITFTYTLIGSAKRNLVLRHHNKGYDCDYKITIQKNINKVKEKELKQMFMDAFNKVIVPMGYNHCEDSTQAITMKKVVKKESKIEKGYDVIITKDLDDGTHILRNDKNKRGNVYHYVQMKDTQNFYNNYAQIKGSKMWEDLREKYKKKREDNENLPEEKQKKGFQLLSDTVNELIN